MIKTHGAGYVTAPHATATYTTARDGVARPETVRDAVNGAAVNGAAVNSAALDGCAAVADCPAVGDHPVVGDRVAEWTFTADPVAVRAARAAVCREVSDWGVDEACDIAVLVVSELVTNAVRYAGAPIGVRLSRRAESPGTLLVEVSDPVPDPPRARKADLDDETGRGLHLLAMCARRWGTRSERAGKTVWFELTVPRPAER